MRKLIMLPGPTNVPERVMNAMLKPIINHRGQEFEELYKSVVDGAKYVFQTKGDMFILASSSTGGVECSLSNIISGGDKIIVPVNGVFSERVKETAEAFGAKPVEIPVQWGKAVTIDQIEEAVKKEKNVKAIAVVYNETSTGAMTKCLKDIGELCDEAGLLFIVDAVSILGGDYLPVDDWHVDICVAGSQKCLMCPPGLALVSVSDKAWSVIEKTKPHAFYFNLLAYRKFQKRGETPFTPAIPLFYALNEALQMIREEGLENAIRRHKACSEALYRAVEALKLNIFADKEFRSTTVVTIRNPEGIKDQDLRKLLKDKYGVVVAGGMGKLEGLTFRIGVMGAVSPAEILQTVTSLESALLELGYQLNPGDGVSAAKEVFARRFC
jgi:aspartate aminotransferase-like enzyme